MPGAGRAPALAKAPAATRMLQRGKSREGVPAGTVTGGRAVVCQDWLLGGFPSLLTGSVPPCLSFPAGCRGAGSWPGSQPGRQALNSCFVPAALVGRCSGKANIPRLRAGCSLSPAAGEGHRERGCTTAGERRGPTAPGMLRIPPPLHPRLRPGALRAGQTPESGGDPRAPAERGARSSRRGSGACCRARELAAGAAGLACGGEGRREEHSSHI